MTIASSISESTIRLGLRALLGAPALVQRVLAGPTVVLDGATLGAESQILVRLANLAGPRVVDEAGLRRLRVQVRRGMRIAGGWWPIAETLDMEVAGLPGRLYTPSTAVEEDGPRVLFLHGGGFITGDIETYDGVCRFLAERSGVRLLAVDYRLAPEHA